MKKIIVTLAIVAAGLSGGAVFAQADSPQFTGVQSGNPNPERGPGPNSRIYAGNPGVNRDGTVGDRDVEREKYFQQRAESRDRAWRNKNRDRDGDGYADRKDRFPDNPRRH